MRQPRGARGAAGALAASVIAALLVCSSATVVDAEEPFEISGEVDGLFPGADVTLETRVTNPYPFAIRVVSTRATVLDARDGCPASLLEVEEAQASVDIPALGTGMVPLSVQLDRDAPDACQGATWPLVFTGTALVDGANRLPETNMFGVVGSIAPIIAGVVLVVCAVVLAGRARRRHDRRVA